MTNIRRLSLRTTLLCACIIIYVSSSAAVIYVNPTAAGSNNGTSWANAFTTLQAALSSAVMGDEIWVAQGVYKPVTQVDVNLNGAVESREATFQLPDGVALYGGFAGTEATRDERNWQTNLTILSGDIDNNDVNLDGNFIAESTTNVVGSNAYHVIHTINVSATTLLDGFIVTAGRAEFAGDVNDENQDGGGWYNRLEGGVNASSPSIKNTTFQGNYCASEGGALYNTNAATGGTVLSLIDNCKFIANESNFAGGAIALGSFQLGTYQVHIINSEFTSNEAYRRGGAIYLVGDQITVDSTVFTNNMVTVIFPGETRPGSGGAVAMTTSNATFNHCIFTGNSATGNPTGPFEGGGGGAVYMSANETQNTTLGVSEPKFVSCGFYNNVASGNTAAWGGAAVHLSDAGQLKPSYVNCVFSGNEAQNDGGAIANFTRVIGLNDDAFVPELSPIFTNCTFAGNQAGSRGGAIYNDGYLFMGNEVLSSKLENCILWNDAATVQGPEVHNTGINLVTYSLVEGSGGSGGAWNAAIGTDGGNNIDEDPDFVNEGDPDGADNTPATGDDGLRLGTTSPAVNEGNSLAAGLAGITTDFALGARILGAHVDMGAYERSGIILPDLDLYWLSEWRPFDPGCLSCPWSFSLFDRTLQYFVWDGPAQFVDKGESAYIKGHIVNTKNKKIGFDVYLKLVNKQDWKTWSSKGRTYSAVTFEAILTAIKTHTRWNFWELSSESYLRGTGDIEGELQLVHAPANYKIGFQLGTGANGWDKDLGMGGSFAYRGTIKQRGISRSIKGVGSMNVDATLCTKDCVPFEEGPRTLDVVSVSETVDARINAYPVPAKDHFTISPETLEAANYTVRLYDNKGALKKTENMNTEQGNLIVPVSDLEPGIYVLKLIAQNGDVLTRKIIIE
jgi:predicted outer membrane repeat protein